MVFIKAKVGFGSSSSRRTHIPFYSENEAANFVTRKSMPVNKPSSSTEKGKNSCGKVSVGRRALADVSNVQARKIEVVSTSHGSKITNVSARISIQGGQSQGVPDLHNSKKVGIKDSKAPSNSQNANARRVARESVVANGRRTTRNSLIPTRTMTRNSQIPTRKSLPVLKRVNQAEIPKGGQSEGVPDLHSSKKAGVKGLKATSNSQNNNATRVPCESIVANGRTTRNSLIPTRKSLPVLKRVNQAEIPKVDLSRKPTVKTTIKASNVKLNSKANPITAPNKLVTMVLTLSKSKEPVISSRCENITQESIHEQLLSDGDSKPSTSDIATKNCSRRRRSYTSLLVEGSKLLEQHDALKQEKLPIIDDDGNQLEVVDYIEEIYQYYWRTEALNPALANYMSIQTEISPHMRAVLINWLIEVHFKFDLMQETLYLMVTLLDRYLSQVNIKKSKMQLVGLTALLLASKYEDFWHPRVQDLLAISAEPYTRDQILEMEKVILSKLKFQLNTPTLYVFMLRFLKAAQSDMKLEHLGFYLIELCLVEYEALMFKPSLLCASAIFVARCTLQITPWTPLLCQHAHYEVSQLRDCAEMILRFQQAAGVGQLKVTYDKYMSPDLSCVAAIKPLDRLPI